MSIDIKEYRTGVREEFSDVEVRFECFMRQMTGFLLRSILMTTSISVCVCFYDSTRLYLKRTFVFDEHIDFLICIEGMNPKKK